MSSTVTFDLTAAFPSLLPRAIAWAEQVSRDAFPGGITLAEHGLALAGSVGVRNPKRVRVTALETMPLPNDPELKAAALQVGLLGPGVVGLTLGLLHFAMPWARDPKAAFPRASPRASI